MAELRLDWMGAVLVVMLLLILWSFYAAHRNPRVQINLFDLVIEGDRLSKIAVTFMVAFMFTTWLMIYLTLSGKMTEGYLVIYGGLWVTPLVARVLGTKHEPTINKELTSHDLHQ